MQLIKPIWILARVNLTELLRDKLLYGIGIVSALVVASSFFLANISLGQDARVLQNIGFAAIHFVTVIISIFVTTTAFAKDEQNNTLYLLLPKPISRAQYLLGKFFGSVLFLLTTLIGLSGFFALGLYFTFPQILFPLLIASSYFFMEISLLIATSLLFSTFTAPLNATLYTLSLFFIGHSLTTLKQFVVELNSVFLKFIVEVLYYILPNLEKFSIEKPLLYGLTIPAIHPIATAIYWILYTSVVLFLASLVLRNSEV